MSDDTRRHIAGIHELLDAHLEVRNDILLHQ